MVEFATKSVSKTVLQQIKDSIKKIKGGYGSVEIVIQNHCVTQISTREITKTNEPVVAGAIKRATSNHI